MRKILIFIMIFAFAIFSSPNSAFLAEDFNGREDEMNKKCAVREDGETQQECIAYKENQQANEICKSMGGTMDYTFSTAVSRFRTPYNGYVLP